MKASANLTVKIAAWSVVLLCSLLPRVILQEIFGQTVSMGMQAVISLGVIAFALLVALIWQPLHGLRHFLILFLVFTGIRWLVYEQLDRLPVYRSWLTNPSFNVFMLAEQSLHLVVTLVMVAALFMLGKKRADFYLARGDISAPAAGVNWLGVRQGEAWSRAGLRLTIYISLGTLAFLVIAGRPPAEFVLKALPYLPAVLLAAALNAFNEEVSYKAGFLSVLEGPVGARQAVYMVAVYFGIAHYYGVPYGVVGVLLATFLGWLLARSMQETRGLFWAWFIHFWQDVWIFSFLAIGSIIPGGG